MSSKAKRKGYRIEVQIRDKHIKAGIPCERVPLSGLMGGNYDGDLCIPNVAEPVFKAEVKGRASGKGFKVLENWMKDKNIMFLKRDNQDPMVILDWETYLKLMSSYMDLQIDKA